MPEGGGFDGNMALMQQSMHQSAMGGNGGGGTLFGISLNFGSMLSPEGTGLAMFMNQAKPIINLNPSHPNGLLSKLLQLLQLDQLLGGGLQRFFQGAQRNQTEYEGLTSIERPNIESPEIGMSR